MKFKTHCRKCGRVEDKPDNRLSPPGWGGMVDFVFRNGRHTAICPQCQPCPVVEPTYYVSQIKGSRCGHRHHAPAWAEQCLLRRAESENGEATIAEITSNIIEGGLGRRIAYYRDADGQWAEEIIGKGKGK